MEISLQLIKNLIPNVLFETDDEPSLLLSLTPWIDEAQSWLMSNITGSSEKILEYCDTLAAKVIVYRAFALAIPHLDITVTPTGFGVVSTQNLAPASKDRVSSLVNGAWASHEKWLSLLMRFLFSIEDWRRTPQAAAFSSSMISNPDDISNIPHSPENVVNALMEASSIAARFEEVAADRYIGRKIMDAARNYKLFSIVPEELEDEEVYLDEVADSIKMAVISWVKYVSANPDLPHEPHHRTVFSMLRRPLALIKENFTLYALCGESSGRNEQRCEQAPGAFFF